MVEPERVSLLFNVIRMQTLYLLGIVLGLWFLGLTVVLYKLFRLFAKLRKGVEEDLARRGFAEAKKRLDQLEAEGKNHVQKVALIRFNPFRELGGDHSFSLAILDGKDSGVVITSLHTRDRTRIYMKSVVRGKSESDLSSEERKALISAQKR